MIRFAAQFLLTAFGLCFLWQSVIWLTQTPPYILPSPLAVLQCLYTDFDVLWRHSRVTVLEIALSLGIASVFGTATSLILMINARLRRWLQPLILVSQTMPVYALAPILMLWFGYGLTPKIIITVLIVYFPITTATFDGLQQTPPAYLRLAQTLGANPRQILWRIRMPAALPHLASGLRVGAAMAPIGAIIGEYVGGSDGLGYLMQYGINRSQVALTFAALFVMTLLTLAIYYGIDALLKKWIYW